MELADTLGDYEWVLHNAQTQCSAASDSRVSSYSAANQHIESHSSAINPFIPTVAIGVQL